MLWPCILQNRNAAYQNVNTIGRRFLTWQPIKIFIISTETKKMKFIRWEKVWIKLLEIVQVTVPIFFLFLWNLKNEVVMAKKTVKKLILTNFSNNVKKWLYLPHFSDYIKIKKDWNSNLNDFQQFCIHTFSHPMNLIFWS